MVGIASSAAAGGFDPVAERLLQEARERSKLELGGRERLARWASALAFLGASTALVAFAPSSRHVSLVVLAITFVSYAVASRVGFEVGSGYALPTELVLIPMLFVLPLPLVPLVVALALVVAQSPSYLTGKVPLERAIVQIGSAWFVLGPTLVLLALGEPSAHPDDLWLLALILPAQFLADFGSTAANEWLALRVPPRELLSPMLWVFGVDALLAPIGFLAASSADDALWSIALPMPLLALVSLFARERQQRLDHVLELSTAYQGTAFLLGDVIDADDEYTGAHSRQVVDLVLGVSDRMGLDARSRRVAEFTALLHDVGKIRIPSEIINKRGPLTPDEREIINTHTIEGEQLLLPVGGLLAEVGTIVRSCHERVDGKGYPDSLAGDDIPLIARIVCCCDAYNAMTTDRSYRKALTPDAALAEVLANRGTQFDEEVVDALVAVVG
jgi:HD-GYP domain-containing protein (c-di-GMP phosphodiesterase class II)